MKLFAWIFIAIISPFMVCDPSPQVSQGGYEVWEVTSAYPKGRLAYSGKNESDGSIKMNLADVPAGSHLWNIRYVLGSSYSTFISCVMTVTVQSYRNKVKTYDYSSVNKSWVLKVPSAK